MIKAILFDLDGVLVDAGKWHYEALNAALVLHAYLPISGEEHRNEFDGLPTRTKLARLVERGRIIPNDVSSIAALKQKETWRIIHNVCVFDPDKYCLLAGLRRAGYRIGIVSNAIYNTVDLVCSRMGLAEMIDAYTTNEDGEPKPSPALYALAVKRFGYSPDECLAIEDSKYGIEAAKGAGCCVLSVTNSKDVTPVNVWKAIEGCNANNSDTDGRERNEVQVGGVRTS